MSLDVCLLIAKLTKITLKCKILLISRIYQYIKTLIKYLNKSKRTVWQSKESIHMIIVQDILIPLSLSQGRHQESTSAFCLSEPKQTPESLTKGALR